MKLIKKMRRREYQDNRSPLFDNIIFVRLRKKKRKTIKAIPKLQPLREAAQYTVKRRIGELQSKY